MSTLNKTELVSAIAERTGKTKTEAKLFLDATIDTITEELVKGHEINLIGFLSLKVDQVAERKGRNPSTGQEITIAARKAVKVSVGKGLKDAVNH